VAGFGINVLVDKCRKKRGATGRRSYPFYINQLFTIFNRSGTFDALPSSEMTDQQGQRRGNTEMKGIRVCKTETIETNRVCDFSDGAVTICEREVHEYYEPKPAMSTRLIISDAIDRTRTFISKAREDFSELNSIMDDLLARP
jgi:hypothetical protein